MAPTILALCAGIGGLELGVSRALGGARVLGYVERDAYAASVLLARMESQDLEPAPVWCGELQDLADADLAALRGRVDIITAGMPCQPFSLAGKGKGLEDERAIAPEVLRIIEGVMPSVVFCENVPAWVSRGFARGFFGGLHRLGFEVEEPFYCRAADVGAPHKRERVFALAHRCGERRERGAQHDERAATGIEAPGGNDAGRRTATLSDAYGESERRGRLSRADGDSGNGPRVDAANTNGTAVRAQQVTESERGGEAEPGEPCAHRFPPGLGDGAGWREYLAASPKAQPAIRRSADGLPFRLDRLRCLGNAVVPQQGELAARVLFGRIGRA